MVKKRESCRNFNGKKVSEEDLEKIIRAANLAPSACNAQPYSFIAVTEDYLRLEIAKEMQSFNQKAGAFIIIFEEKACIPVKVINTFKVQDYTKIDIGIVASYICLAATELKIATCMIGLFNENKIKQILKMEQKRIRLIISLGYNEEKPRPKQRKSVDNIYKCFY